MKAESHEFTIVLFLLECLFQLANGIFLRILSDVDVRLHRLVVGVSGEFHHDIRSDADGQGKADEGLATGMRTDEFVLGIDVIMTSTIPIASDGVWSVESADLTEVLQAAVHLLVRHVRQRPSAREILIPILVQYGLCVLVKYYRQSVMGLLRRDNQGAILDIHTADFDDIAVSEAREGAEAEEVPCPFRTEKLSPPAPMVLRCNAGE